MNKEIAKLKEDTDKMLNGFSINVLQGEEKLIEEIDNLFKNDNADIEKIEGVVKVAEEYLKMKEKLFMKQEDFRFLKEVAKELRGQKIRKVDQRNLVLFKIKNSIGEDMYYLTRKAAKEFCKIMNSDKELEVVSINCLEIVRLLDVIQRNF